AAFAGLPPIGRLVLHWYIFGPAWTVEESRRQLRLMRDAHIGGILIFPTYPIALDDAAKGIHNQSYLSAEFLGVLQAVVEDARGLGMTVDLVAGTGWPYGGPSVTLEDSAKMIRRSVLPAGAPVPEPGRAEETVAVISDPQSGLQQVFSAVPTRMHVKRPSVGAEGFCVDHYSGEALRRYLDEVAGKLLAAVPKGSLRSLFCDSLEVYRSTWTAGFLEIFQRRRGYDLKPHMAALFDDSHSDARDLRYDFWRTLSEQAVDGFLKSLQEWTRGHGVQAMVEAYGSPPVNLTGYRYTDIPAGEHYEWKEFNSSRWASSGGRLAGKNMIMAEGWTWAGLPNRFADTLEQLKLCSDLHFLSGINSIYGLTYAYSPVELGSPGWPPYFGPVLNHTIPAWPYVSHLADYINRVSFALQQGKPVADVALYLGAEDSMAEASIGQLMLNWATRDRLASNGPPPEFTLHNALNYESNVVKTIVTNGYSFDGVDTFVFNDGMRIEGGRLRQGDGDYAILVLPNLAGIDAASLVKIKTFVEQGGIAIATRRLPATSYGIRSLGKGHAVFCRDEKATLLAALRLRQPDITFTEASEHVSFAHRRTADADFYFLVNTSEAPLELDATFRVGQAIPQRWDARTGETSPERVYQHVPAGTRLSLSLGPLESRILVFTRDAASPSVLSTNLPRIEGGAAGWSSRVRENGSYFLDAGSGRRRIVVDDVPAPRILAPVWRLTFEGSAIDPVRLPKLQSWTSIPAARYFSGRGRYEAEIELPDPGDLGCILDLGIVHETAEVFWNGEPAGVAWMRPYELDITRLLRPGVNRLRIDVTNLLINKVLGMGPIDYSQVGARYGTRFPAGDEWDYVREPVIAGLLGAVRLVYYRTVRGL
ncbi:MAG: glycosyl hydrolase, partial [Acidobacteria bacterium]|nr:glycosyl hydrolase [Acidobacteriota bacterium]